jgi:hypothetical protein
VPPRSPSPRAHTTALIRVLAGALRHGVSCISLPQASEACGSGRKAGHTRMTDVNSGGMVLSGARARGGRCSVAAASRSRP